MFDFRTLGLGLLTLGTLAACDAGLDTPSDDAPGAPPALVEANGTIGSRYQPLSATFHPADGASSLVPLTLTTGYQIAAPSGTAATHLTVSSAGVVTPSYLAGGAVFGGGFDRISEDGSGVGTGSAYVSSYVDLASVAYVGADLLVAGSVDIENPAIAAIQPRILSAALLAKVNPATGLPIAVADLSSQFVMDAVYPAAGDSYYAVTGDDGDVYQIAKADLSATSLGQIADLRSVALSGSSLFVLDGSGTVRVRDLSDASGSFTAFASVGAFASGTIAKMVAHDGTLYVPDGTAGFKAFDAASGTELGGMEIGAVKSFAFSSTHVFVANADGGVLVAEWAPQDGTDYLFYAGRIDFSEAGADNGQVNHLAVVDNALYAAAGDLGVFKVTFGATAH